MKSPYGSRATTVRDKVGNPITEIAAMTRRAKTGTIVRSATEKLASSVPTHEQAAKGRFEFNAGSKKELLGRFAALIDDVRGGNLTVGNERQVTAEAQMERLAIVKEAFANPRPGNPAFEVLGEVIADEIWQTLGRQGFTRKIFITKPVGKGDTGRIRLRKKDVVAFVVTTDANTVASIVRQPYFYPPEFYLTCFILIEDKEIEQASTDIIDEKYQDGLENIMVREDRLTKILLDRAAPTDNDLISFTSFTPSVFTSLRTQVARWGIPVPTAIIAYDIWDDIIADTDFVAWFDPVTKHELILEGKLGSLLDVEIMTDGVRHDTLQVLQPGEVYFLGAPIALGAVTQRKELVANAIDQYNVGKSNRGWFLQQIEGLVVGNSRSVSKGIRV